MLDVEKFKKVWALTRSDMPGEAAAAQARAEAMLAKEGKTLADVDEILNGRPAPEAAPFNPFAGFAEWMEKEEPGWTQRRAAEKAEKRRQQKVYRSEIIKKFGTEEAALSDTPMEAIIKEACAPYSFDFDYLCSNPPADIEAAIKAAIPFPTTISGAFDEYNLWRERNEELSALLGDEIGDDMLAPPCSLRNRFLQDALSHGPRAESVKEALIRARYLRDLEFQLSEEQFRAIVLDLEHLSNLDSNPKATSPVQDGVQNGQGHQTARARRAQVIHILSVSPHLSDREVARQAGVSPQTVGNIRRRQEEACQGAFL